jgi:hypothetical protein
MHSAKKGSQKMQTLHDGARLDDIARETMHGSSTALKSKPAYRNFDNHIYVS